MNKEIGEKDEKKRAHTWVDLCDEYVWTQKKREELNAIEIL